MSTQMNWTKIDDQLKYRLVLNSRLYATLKKKFNICWDFFFHLLNRATLFMNAAQKYNYNSHKCIYCINVQINTKQM